MSAAFLYRRRNPLRVYSRRVEMDPERPPPLSGLGESRPLRLSRVSWGAGFIYIALRGLQCRGA